MRQFLLAIASTLTVMCNTSNAFAADLVETAAASGTFKTFLVAAKAAGLIQTLKNTGPYTVFAPTDMAFKKLPPEVLEALLQDKTRLAQILSYHVIPGKITITEVKPGKAKTIEGDSLTLTSDNGKVTVNRANVIQSDLMADNGIIHEIDNVILPDEHE